MLYATDVPPASSQLEIDGAFIQKYRQFTALQKLLHFDFWKKDGGLYTMPLAHLYFLLFQDSLRISLHHL